VQLDDKRSKTGTSFSKGNAIFQAVTAIEFDPKRTHRRTPFVWQ
jgi:hypothetical protein